MNPKKSEFVLTLADVSQLPGIFTGEYLRGRSEPRMVMVGRSNVGKSTLINALLRADLAQTSKQPGKTRCIHFYSWGEAKMIVADLPGYGYAKASHSDRNHWETLIGSYLEYDPMIERALVLLDARHGPSPEDRTAIQFLNFHDIPVTVVFTKSDTLKTQVQRATRRKEAADALMIIGMNPEGVHWVSERDSNSVRSLSLALRKGNK